MIEKFQNILDAIDHDTTLIIAVSGGVDSMVLLDYCLRIWRSEKIAVAHVHHGIRGYEADDDLDFIANFCNKKNISFFSKKYDIPRLAQTQKIGIEEAGRKYRYEFFYEVSQKIRGKNILLTAHHLDDRIETMMFNLIRGTSLEGLIALRQEGEYSIDDIKTFSLYRPFFHISKKDIIKYAKIRNIKYKEDRTNNDMKYLRNHIRYNIMQNFAEVNPKYHTSIDSFLDYIVELSNEQNTRVISWLAEQNILNQIHFNKYENSQYIFSKEFFLKESEFFQKQIFAFIYRKQNKSGNGLSKHLISELQRFIRDKNSYGKKQIKNLFFERRGEKLVVYGDL